MLDGCQDSRSQWVWGRLWISMYVLPWPFCDVYGDISYRHIPLCLWVLATVINALL